jgi:HK97 family phage major capsid protein
MKPEEMNLEQIEARLSELDVEVRGMTTLDAVESATQEKTLLIERKSELTELEIRKQTALNIASGTVQTKKVEERKEDKTMEFNEMTREELLASTEYRNAWIKNLQGKALTETEKRAYASTDSANAIPTMTSEKFFEKLKKLAPMINEITLLRVAGNLKFVTEGTNTAVDVKHTENSAIAAGADTILNVTLSGYEFLKVISISATVSTMSVGAFESWLVSMLARDISRAIDNYIINDTTNGIAVVTTWTSNTNQILNTAGPTYGNICSLIALLPAGYDANAKFLMNKKTLWNKLATIVDSQGQPIMMTDMQNGFQRTILGYPVLIDDYVTTANDAIYLGDYETIVGNMAQDVLVESSKDSGFKSNMIDYRGTAIFDSKPANKEAIVRFVTTA